MTVIPSSEALPPLAAAWGQPSFLAEASKAPFPAGAWRAGGLERGSEVAAQQGHLPSVPPAPLPPLSPLRLRVHHSGDPWELEANFPRSLVMERPQVLPLIKVKRGAEEKRSTQASSSHL